MWSKYGLVALLALFTSGTAPAQYFPPARYYPPRHREHEYGRQYAPPRYAPYPGGYDQQLPQQDPRQSWSYPGNGGGTFRHTSGNQWVEYRNGQSPISFTELSRTPDYVEIFDPNRNLHVRLYPNQLWQATPGGDWQVAYEGRWD